MELDGIEPVKPVTILISQNFKLFFRCSSSNIMSLLSLQLYKITKLSEVYTSHNTGICTCVYEKHFLKSFK